MPRLNLDDATAIPGYNNAAAIEHVLKQCGDNLTRENLLKQATNLKGYTPPFILEWREGLQLARQLRRVP